MNKKTKAAKRIVWAATPYGYGVRILGNRGRVLHQYTAGNYKRESQTYVKPGTADTYTRDELRPMAEQTANEFAKWNDVTDVAEDAKLEKELLAEFIELDQSNQLYNYVC